MVRQEYFTKGFLGRGVFNLSPSDAFHACDQGAVMIDVREDYHSFLHTFQVEQLFYCPFSELKTHLDKVPKDVPVIMADAAGLRSIEAVLLLQEEGFINVANLAGGMLEWNQERLPVVLDKTRRISGSCMCMLKYRETNRKTL